MAIKSIYISASHTRFGRSTRKQGLLGVLLRAYSIWRERQHLAELDDHLLKDIGVTKDQAEAEAERPVWDAPSRWFL